MYKSQVHDVLGNDVRDHGDDERVDEQSDDDDVEHKSIDGDDDLGATAARVGEDAAIAMAAAAMAARTAAANAAAVSALADSWLQGRSRD